MPAGKKLKPGAPGQTWVTSFKRSQHFQAQKSWMYLEPIFSAPDIQKQLPAESKAFDHVHRQLKEVMRRTKDRPNALQTASNPSELMMRGGETHHMLWCKCPAMPSPMRAGSSGSSSPINTPNLLYLQPTNSAASHPKPGCTAAHARWNP